MAGGWLNLESATSVIPETQFFEGDSAFKSLGLSRTTRLYGFIGCLVVGFVLSLLGAIVLFFQQLGIFAVLFGIGTVISLVGTGFLIGFLKQLKLMFKPVRVVAAIVFLASIGMIFVAAFVIKSDVLCLVFVFIEYLAYIWYTLSYIPYARAAVTKAVGLG
ncbi:SFT2-domain-containing protein [Coprinellus micaceus]|uniref:Protein transport protein SFT2 n=1 Tax=Coprinellus micaceus TaxID=71717 RepID=A0A4Y7TPX9_COPMI|nr:SFT2-domain-containing protein [Coprinellus micaceus]